MISAAAVRYAVEEVVIPSGRRNVLAGMQTIYDSSLFCVVAFSDFGAEGQHPAGGFEIMDKTLRREIFLGGRDAERFRASVQELIASEPSPEQLDDFLAAYTGVMNTPVALH